MSNKSFVSDQGLWVDLAGTWSNRITVNNYVDGVRAAEEINHILREAPADVGGEIAFSYTVADAEKLYRDWHILHKFTNGIHYEAVELIDAPFVQKMDPIMQSVYDLNPKDFRTEKNFLFFSRGSSLQDVLLDMVNTEELKVSFASMIGELDNDKPDTLLVEVVSTANYWMVQFEKASEIRSIATDFLAEHEKNWAGYTSERKLELLNEYGLQVGDVLDEHRWYDFFGGKDTVTSIDWNIDDTNPHGKSSTAYGYTYAESRNGKIYINFEATTNTDMYSLPFLLDTITHESRHQNQGQSHNDPKRFNLPKYNQTEWFDRIKYPDEKYWIRPWEIDARAFSALTQLSSQENN